MNLPVNTKEGIEKLKDPELNDQQDNSSENGESAKAAPEPNIIFVGDKEPITKIQNSQQAIKLPAITEQAAVEEQVIEGTEATKKVYTGIPFYHKDASTIVTLFGDQYKFFKKKGE